MKTALLILGIAALLMGLLFAGQGTGMIMWPDSSFNAGPAPVDNPRHDPGTSLGVVLIILARRR